MSALYPTLAEAVGVPFTRLLDETAFEVAVGAVDGIATFKVAPEDVWTFLQQVAGTPTAVTVGGGSTMVRRVPCVHPENAALFAYRASVAMRGARQFAPSSATPESGPPGGPYGWARVQVGFMLPTFNPAGGDYSSYTMNAGTNFVTYPNGMDFRFGDGTPTGQDVGVWVPQQTYQYTRHWVPDIQVAEAVAAPYVGQVNSSPLTIGKTTWAAGTVLFAGLDTAFSRGGDGMVLASDVVVNLACKRVPWNSFLKPTSPYGFQPIADGGGDGPYEETDLSPLLSL